MESPPEANTELRTRVRQQEIVAELGRRALDADDLDQLMHDASVAVVDALDADCLAVFELAPDGPRSGAVLRDGVGWRDGLVGTAVVSTGPDSQVGYALDREEPTVVTDLREDDRFSGPELLTSHGVRSGVGVLVGPHDDPWGVLGTYATEGQKFTERDANFVRSVANVLASAIQNERTLSELDEIYGRISDAFFALDREWRFTYLNERAHEMINPEGRTLVGRNVWEEFPKAVGREFKSQYERAMYEQETVSFEEYYPEPLDSWFEVRAYPSETGLSVYFRDVTDRKERERALERTERRFGAIFEDPNILVGLLEPDGTVLDINQTAMEYIDADLDEVTGEPFWETPWWGESDEVGDEVREWTERAAAGEYVDFQADLTRPDGQQYTLEGFFRPVTNDDGEVVSIIVSDRDVSERREYERQLEESERRYRTLAEAFPNGVVTLYDEDLRYTLAAGRAFEELPVSPDDLESRTPREAWGDDVGDALEPALRAALDGEEEAVEISYADREWQIHAVPITDEHGDVFAGMTMAQDVTEQKERERYLRDAKSQLEAATEAGAVGTWEWHIPEDEFVTGASFASTFGVDPDAAREGVPLDRIVSSIHEDDRERVERRIEEAMNSCGEYEEEYRVWDADDELRWVVARGHVECDDDGNPVTFPGALTDITERKRVEQALQESEKQLRTLLRILPVGVIVAEVDGQLVEANEAAKEIWGGFAEAETVADYERYRGWWPDSGERVTPEEWPLARALRGEEIVDPEIIEIRRFDGERRRVLFHAMPVRDASGEVMRAVVTMIDVTEREERQQRLEAQNERLESFASMLAHELRNPVTIGQIYSQQLPEETGAEAVEYVREAFDRIEEMIDVMLVLTRSREAVGERTPIDLASMAREVWDDLDAPEATLDADIDRTIRADETYVRHLFRNLLENAVEHGSTSPRSQAHEDAVEHGSTSNRPSADDAVEHGGADVTVTVGELPSGFYVADDGPGIPPEDRDAVFDEGYTTAAGQGGTGLGLAFVQELADVYGWDYAVTESEFGGARFEFTNVDQDAGGD